MQVYILYSTALVCIVRGKRKRERERLTLLLIYTGKGKASQDAKDWNRLNVIGSPFITIHNTVRGSRICVIMILSDATRLKLSDEFLRNPASSIEKDTKKAFVILDFKLIFCNINPLILFDER